MKWKLYAATVAIALAAAFALPGCGAGGEGSKKSSKPRTPPQNVLQNAWLDVPGGEYRVGDKKWPNFPAGKVSIEGFSIQKYEVTNHQYKQWLDTLSPEDKETHTPKGDPITGKGAWTNGWYAEGRENFPVTNVTLDSAIAYAEAIGATIPDRIRWEVAARGPDANIFPWGNTFDPTKCNCDNAQGGPKQVGSYEAGKSWCGAYDMAGNVWEWTLSFYDQGHSPFRLLKGGCYYDNAADFFEASNSLSAEADKIDQTYGFRCIKK